MDPTTQIIGFTPPMRKRPSTLSSSSSSLSNLPYHFFLSFQGPVRAYALVLREFLIVEEAHRSPLSRARFFDPVYADWVSHPPSDAAVKQILDDARNADVFVAFVHAGYFENHWTAQEFKAHFEHNGGANILALVEPQVSLSHSLGALSSRNLKKLDKPFSQLSLEEWQTISHYALELRQERMTSSNNNTPSSSSGGGGGGQGGAGFPSSSSSSSASGLRGRRRRSSSSQQEEIEELILLGLTGSSTGHAPVGGGAGTTTTTATGGGFSSTILESPVSISTPAPINPITPSIATPPPIPSLSVYIWPSVSNVWKNVVESVIEEKGAFYNVHLVDKPEDSDYIFVPTWRISDAEASTIASFSASRRVVPFSQKNILDEGVAEALKGFQGCEHCGAKLNDKLVRQFIETLVINTQGGGGDVCDIPRTWIASKIRDLVK